MEKIVTVEEMRAIEKEADLAGLSYEEMMENAGRGLSEIISVAYSHNINKSICALVGSGNNGGDALVCIEYLAKMGWKTSVYQVRPRPEGDRLLARVRRLNCPVYSSVNDQDLQILAELLVSHSFLLDGVLGTGITLPIRGRVAECLGFVKNYIQEGGEMLHVVAVDCPSGVDCDTGGAANEVIPAELTVTMAAVKQGLLCFPAANYTGKLRVVNIGNLSQTSTWNKIKRTTTNYNSVIKLLPPRPRNAHKGTFGTALIIAGSSSYTGAVLLAGKAALKSGVGLVQMGVPETLHRALSGHIPDVIWELLPQEDGFISQNAVKNVLECLPKASAWLIGPGMGIKNTTSRFIVGLLESEDRLLRKLPVVADADGLKLIGRIPGWYKKLHTPSILTPHPGEMALLTNLTIQEVQSNRLLIAEKYSHMWGHVVILKGAYTIVASPDGRTVVVPIATPALAKAGTGDVLAGLVVGFLAQGLPPFDAAVAGAWIHAAAGLKMETHIGMIAASASDLVDEVGEILREMDKDKLN